MARGARQIVVQFLGDTKDFDRAVGKVEGGSSKLSRNLKRVGVAAGVGLTAGAVVAGKALFDMGKAAADDAQQQALLAKALENNAGATKAQVAATEDWITAQGKAFGVADDKLRPALSDLVRATGDVSKAQELASLAMDVSAGSGKDLGAVSKALAKAQNGNVSGLSRLGIATKDANGKTKTFAKIQDELSKKFKGSASTAANTFQGKMARLKLQFDEAKESLGAKLLPVAEKFADWFISDAVPAIKKFTDKVVEVVRKHLPELQKQFDKNFKAVRDIVKSVVEIVTVLWRRFGDTILNYTQTTLKNILAVVGGVLKIIAGVFKTISAIMRGDWSAAWDGIKQIVSGALQAIKGLISQAFNVIKTYFVVLGKAVAGIFGNMWSNLKSMVSKGASGIVDAVRAIPGKILGLAKYFRSAGASIIQAFIGGIKSGGKFLGGIAGSIWNALKGLINDAIDGLNRALDFDLKVKGIGFHINAPNIPHLASGGVVRARPGGTLALLAEGGRDEAVVPLGSAAARRAIGTDVQRHIIELRLNGRLLREIQLNTAGNTGVNVGVV